MFVQRLLLKVGLMLGGLFAVLMYLPGPDGEPLMSIEDLPGFGVIQTASELAEEASEVLEASSGGNEIYQWVDENGTIHFSDEPISGAKVRELQAGNDPIPADNFTGVAFKKEKPSNKSKAFLIGDSSTRAKAGSGGAAIKPEDFKGLMDGDYSNAREIVKGLPEYLEDQHRKRMQVLDQ